MAILTATARQVDGTLQHEIETGDGHVVVTDEPVAAGGGDVGPTPHELLVAAAAGCVSTMIALYAQRKGWEVAGLRVDAAYDSEAVPRHLAVTVQLPDGLSEDQVLRLTRVAQTCPVVRALETGFTVDERLVTAMNA